MTDDPAVERLERALADLGAEHEPPPGWQARVIAAVEPRPRRRWWLLLAPALALAALVLWLAWPETAKPRPLQLALALDRGPVMRGSTAHVGDTLHATATGGATRALWIYRDDRTLVLACPGDAACRATSGTLAADLTFATRGSYAIVALSAPHALATPTGSLDADVAAATAAGATYTIDTVDVD